jgi:hypothetical protein
MKSDPMRLKQTRKRTRLKPTDSFQLPGTARSHRLNATGERAGWLARDDATLIVLTDYLLA